MSERCPYCQSPFVSGKGKEAYEFRKNYFLSWSEVAVSVGYASGDIARKAAKKYAEERGLLYPLPRSTKGACIYVSRKSGYTEYQTLVLLYPMQWHKQRSGFVRMLY